MGLFDKLKKAISPTTPSGIMTPAATPASKPLEDLSGLDNLQVLEKIDSYCSAYASSLSNGKLNDSNALNDIRHAVNEFDKRFNALPLSQRGGIAQDWRAVTSSLTCIDTFINSARNSKALGFNTDSDYSVSAKGSVEQIQASVAKLYTELTK